MTKSFLYFSLVFFLFACGNSTETATTAPPTNIVETTPNEADTETVAAPTTEESETADEAEPFTAIYRCDGFYPGIVSEWIAITSAPEKGVILKAEYWNTTDEAKIPLRIIEQTFHEEGMPGYDGILAFPGQDPIGFGIVEDLFNLTHNDDRFQQFSYEWE